MLDAVVRTGSFAAAGAELRRATSAVSYGVRALEGALGISLFDRGGHRAELTDEGRRILEEGRALLDRADALVALASQLDAQWEASFTLVVDGIFPQRALMRAIARFTREGAPTHVRVRVEHLGGVRERFASERADAMLTLDWDDDPRFVASAMAPIEMLLVASASHPLRRGNVDRARLAEHVELMVEDSRQHDRPRRGRLALGSPHVLTLSDFESKRTALLEGVGFGWMPRHLVADDLRKKKLARLRYAEGNRYVFPLHLVQRRGALRARGAQRVLALLADELRSSRRVSSSSPRSSSA